MNLTSQGYKGSEPLQAAPNAMSSVLTKNDVVPVATAPNSSATIPCTAPIIAIWRIEGSRWIITLIIGIITGIKGK